MKHYLNGRNIEHVGSEVTHYLEGNEIVATILSQNEYVVLENGKEKKFRGVGLDMYIANLKIWITEIDYFEI